MEQRNSFENVLLFVSDSLRYDAAQRVFDEKHVAKTIAAGTWSPLSFSSIITGQSAGQHSVLSFDHKLDPKIPTLFEMVDNTSFVNQGEQLGHVLGTESRVPRKPLEEMEPPFLYMERCLIPHAPYNHGAGAYVGSVKDYCISNSGNINRDYAEAAKSTVHKFHNRVRTLRERGLLEDTLIIFTSDHGELLGEHGLYGHGTATTPELVYVPTVVFNEGVDITEDGMGHIDLYPTIADVFDSDVPAEVPGLNLFEENVDGRKSLVLSKYDEQSVWDTDGGFVFYEKSLLFKIAWFAHNLVRHPYANLNRKHPLRLFQTAMYGGLDGVQKWGAPTFDKATAKEVCDEKVTESPSIKRDLDSTSKEKLRDLGYID